jgi:hypothetical protein
MGQKILRRPQHRDNTSGRARIRLDHYGSSLCRFNLQYFAACVRRELEKLLAAMSIFPRRRLSQDELHEPLENAD